MQDLSKRIGLVIREHRIEKNIIQERLALMCDIDRSYLGRIERGEVNITVVKLSQIALILEISIKDLLP